MDEEQELDVTKLKYVLYARKSTDDPKRQLRSIPDQILECREKFDRLLNIVDTVEETESAKKPNLRPKFTQMLKDIRSKKYDGIVSWNPDRLARNMREGGEIIDMIDEGQILDLKFVTHTFSNDANGKMLLGMAFVLSKQYSDDLSQKVSRGVNRKLMEGKSSSYKQGYAWDENDYYRPNGKYHELIAKAWKLRTEGTSLKDVAKWLTNNGYVRIITSEDGAKRKIFMNDKILSKVFRDPFYYGILIQKGKEVDLRGLYDFIPAVSEKDFYTVQALTDRRIKPIKSSSPRFYPLRSMVICSFCKSNMVVGYASGSQRKYLYFRCDSDFCKRKKRSIRTNVVFDFVTKFVGEGLNLTEKQYRKYLDEIETSSKTKESRIKQEINTREGLLKVVRGEIRERSLGIIKLDPRSTAHRINTERIDELGERETSLIDEIGSLKIQLGNPEKDKLSIENFLNISKNAAKAIKSANPVLRDTICRFIFLNFTVNEEKVLSWQLKEPYDILLKHRRIVSGRGDRA